MLFTPACHARRVWRGKPAAAKKQTPLPRHRGGELFSWYELISCGGHRSWERNRYLKRPFEEKWPLLDYTGQIDVHVQRITRHVRHLAKARRPSAFLGRSTSGLCESALRRSVCLLFALMAYRRDSANRSQGWSMCFVSQLQTGTKKPRPG